MYTSCFLGGIYVTKENPKTKNNKEKQIIILRGKVEDKKQDINWHLWHQCFDKDILMERKYLQGTASNFIC